MTSWGQNDKIASVPRWGYNIYAFYLKTGEQSVITRLCDERLRVFCIQWKLARWPIIAANFRIYFVWKYSQKCKESKSKNNSQRIKEESPFKVIQVYNYPQDFLYIWSKAKGNLSSDHFIWRMKRARQNSKQFQMFIWGSSIALVYLKSPGQ